jgi:Ca2+-binding RTX toxin-like protein
MVRAAADVDPPAQACTKVADGQATDSTIARSLTLLIQGLLLEAFVHQLRRVIVATGAIVALGAAAAGPAWSATVERVGDTLSYRAAAGEANDLVLTERFGPGVVLHDAGAPIRAGQGCAALADGGVFCDAGLPAPARVEISLGNRDDRASAEVSGSFDQEVVITGGAGSDTLHSGSHYGNTHVLSGDGGDDHLTAMTNLGGDATFVGGPGNDVLENLEGGSGSFYGGPGDDAVQVGFHGEVPVIDGGPGADTYSVGGMFDPAAVAEVIAPGPGTDTLSAERAGAFTLDLATCRGCVENVIGSPWDDTILGSRAPNVLLGGEGNDVLDPRGGRDTVSGQEGDDQIELRDSRRDAASCGDGLDQVGADARPADAVAADCEEVAWGD